ncbi:MAG: hypothetical protein ACLFWL_14360 [Candidatus Brocadiia bacterium]
MPWEIGLINSNQIVRVINYGTMVPESFKKMAEEALSVAHKGGLHRFLVDQREMEADLSTMEVYDLAEMLHEAGYGPKDRLAHVFVPSSSDAKDFEFYATVCRNQGLMVRVFKDLDGALRWLTGG